MISIRPGDRVIIINSRSYYHEKVGTVEEISGREARFDIKVKFDTEHRSIGFWFGECTVVHSY